MVVMLTALLALPDWAALAVTGLSVLLALATLALLLRRPAATRDPAESAASAPPRLDVMLLVSALAVLALAAVIWLTR